MPSYKLVNPVIVGTLDTTYSGSSANQAAEKAWSSLSKYFTGNLPRFGFTLESTSDNKLYHYLVKEDVNSKTKSVEYNIKPMSIKLSRKQESLFRNDFEKVMDKTQTGGRHRSSSSSSSTESDSSTSLDSASDDVYDKHVYEKIQTFYARRTMDPIVYFYYNPIVYEVIESVFVPNLIVPLTPYLHVRSYWPSFFKLKDDADL